MIYPNPVFEQATIKFNLPEEGNTNVTIFDLQGKLISNANLGKIKKLYTKVGDEWVEYKTE